METKTPICRKIPVLTSSVMMLAAILLGGCVARDAGYQDTQTTVHKRTGHRVHWQHIEAAGDVAVQTEKLLKEPLDVDRAVRIALLNSQRLQASFEELGMARAELVHALRLPNPHAEAALIYEGGGEPPEIELGLTLSLSQLLLMPWRKGAAAAGLDAAKLEVAGRVMDLTLEVRRAFYEYVAAQQTVETRHSVMQASEASRAAAERMHEVGNITDLQFLTEQALHEDAKLAFERALALSARSREQLGMLMGIAHRPTGWKTADRLRSPPKRELELESVERRAVESSLDLEILQHRIQAADRRATVAGAEGWVPELRAGVGAERQEGEWGFGPIVEVELPLFYQGQGGVASAEAEWRRQQALRRAAVLQIRSAARAARKNLEAARASAVRYLTVLLPLRKKIVGQTLLKYNAMGTGVFQLLQAKRDQIQTEAVYVDALREYWIARAELQQLLAGRLVMISAPADTVAGAGSMRSGDAH